MTRDAIFAAGCFWGVEARFRELEGVVETEVGYIGGTTDSPDYRSVCSGRTGHAEAVRVTYDPERIEYGDLLEVFFDLHDPTQVDRQGVDIGSQYRSAIFVDDQSQRALAEAAIRDLEASGRWSAPIATRIEPGATFWRAEEYHQRYLEKSGRVCGV